MDISLKPPEGTPLASAERAAEVVKSYIALKDAHDESWAVWQLAFAIVDLEDALQERKG